VAAARTHADETGVLPGAGDRGRDGFMHAIDGLLYGDSPEGGIVRDRTFLHPKLRIAFTAPSGFSITNGPQAVIVQGPEKTIVKFDAGRKTPDLDIGTYLTSVWADGVDLKGLERFTVDGMNAATSSARVGDYNAQLVAIEAAPGTVYRFLMGTKPEVGARYNKALANLVKSFRRLTEAEARAVKPLRIRIATVRPGDTVETLAAGMAFSDFKVERFRVLNGLGPKQQLTPGMLVKIVGE
jgi:predicted Zn-dependent protease